MLDNLERGHRAAVPAGAELVVGDLLDRAAVEAAVADGLRRRAALRGPGAVGESVSHPERYYRTNVVGTLNLLEAMHAAGVPATRVLLDLRRLRPARRGPDPRDGAAPRPINAYGALQARRRPDDRRLLRPTGSARSACATSTWRGERRPRRGPRPRDPPDPQHPARRAGRRAGASRSSAPTTRRPTAPRPRLHPHRRSRRRAPAGAGRRARRASTGSSTSATATGSRCGR